MTPIPTDNPPYGPPDQEDNYGESRNTATTVVGAVSLFLLVAFIGMTIAFCIHKRRIRNQLPQEHRPRSYRPFRVESSDRSSLLASVQSPDDERSSMFSREQGSVALYLDAEPVSKRVSSQSMETVDLVPLYVTPVPRQEYLVGEIDDVGILSAFSSRYSRDSINLSMIQSEEVDLGIRLSRPRSTSISSVRYYERNAPTSNFPNNPVAPRLPPVPKIIRTGSDQ